MSSAAQRRASPTCSSKRKSSGGASAGADESAEPYVTRGLQEILEKDMATRRSSGSGGSGGASSRAKRKKGSGGGATGPAFVMCYLCGRQFGTSSIDIHRPQCYLKKLIEWQRSDPDTRGPKPVDPDTHAKRTKEVLAAGGGGGSKATELEAYNAAQFDAFTTQALVPCPNCGRTFLPDRLQVHLRSCKPGSTAKPVGHAAPTAAAGTTATAATTATAPATTAEERPIKASGAYHYDAAAEEAARPPSARRAARKSPGKSPVMSPKRNTRAPAAATKADGGSNRVRSVTFRGGRRGSPVLSQPAAGSRARAVRPSDEDSSATHSSTSSLQIEDVGEEAAPISPSAAAEEAAAEHDEEMVVKRHAAIAGTVGGNSTPRRYASMEPGMDGSEASSGAFGSEEDEEVRRERDGATTPEEVAELEEIDEEQRTTQDAANAMEVAEPPLTDGSSRLDSTVGSRDAPPKGRGGAHSARGAAGRRPRRATASESHSTPPRDDSAEDSDDGDGSPHGGKKKIPLNNVSRFKNVQSRLLQGAPPPQVDLVPCKYCGRTFNPQRVHKHESVCAERHKQPAAARHSRGGASNAGGKSRKSSGASQTSAGASRKHSTADEAQATEPTTVSSTALDAAAGASGSGGSGYCTECGEKIASPRQRFCGSCGAKVMASA